ncbi:MAG: prolipoprotein diacylglyceryl transferase [Clostridia bacterium]|nr:prolipoprotein diacylglyceryl transferase [Clostridia bacterium]MBQ4086499.1 prolipoprotein diacylglyceryl transferase [Clostridia bacterium]
MDRVAFYVLGQPIYWYGVVIASAVLLGVLTAALRENKQGLPKDSAVDFALVCMPVAVVFARLYYVAFQWDQYAPDPIKIFDIRSGGLAIYGGLIGGALAAILVVKWKKIRYGRLADLVAPSLALGQGIGRWGNFFNQEAYGRAITDPAWQFFPAGVYIENMQQWHMAAFFYESAWCIFIWLLLEILIRKGAFDKRRDGDVFAWYGLLYCAERSVVEGLRTDSLYWGSVRVSQAASLIAMAVVLVWFILRVKENRKKAIGPFAATALWLAISLAEAFGILGPNAIRMLACNALALAFAFVLYKLVPDITKGAGDTK